MDRHGLRPRDDKVEGAGRLVTHSGSPRAYALAMTKFGDGCPRDDKIVSKRNAQSLCFTLHPSIFTLPSLAFLETYTEAYVAAAAARGEVVALS